MKTLLIAATLASVLGATAPALADDWTPTPTLASLRSPQLGISILPHLALAIEPVGRSESFPGFTTPTPVPAPVRDTTIFGLPRNVGPIDRVLRGVVAGTLIGIGSYGFASGKLSQGLSGALLGISTIPFATATTGYCPIYQVLGIEDTF